LEAYKNVLIGNLSGGQQQRVFIARAISGRQPRVIFLDEPTAGIDEKSQKQFYSLLKKFNQELGMTLVLIAHDLDVVMREVSHVVVINQKLIYYGDPKECPYV
jgi:zinc transport system ATP-binding protein